MGITARLRAEADVTMPSRNSRGVQNGIRQRLIRRVGVGDSHQASSRIVHKDVATAAGFFAGIRKDRNNLHRGGGAVVPAWIRRVADAKEDAHFFCVRISSSNPSGGLAQSVRIDRRSVDADRRIDTREETLRGPHRPPKKRRVQLLEAFETIVELLFLGTVEVYLGMLRLVPRVIASLVTLPDPRQRAAEIVVKRPLCDERRRAAGEPLLVERAATTGTGEGERAGGIDAPNVRQEGLG